MRPGGAVLAEVQPPGAPGWRTEVELHDADRRSDAFPWATVSATEVGALADASAYRLRNLWTEAGRWFTQLTRVAG